MSEKADATVRKKLAATLIEIESRLSNNPIDVGEIYRTSGSIQEYLAASGFLAFDFAVSEPNRLVYVRACYALAGHGLD